MTKMQKTIITVEIILLVIGLGLFSISALNSDKGQRKEITNKLSTLKERMTASKEKYSSNQAILEIIKGKEKEIDELIAKYQDTENEFDFAMENRKMTILETEISCFIDDCVKIDNEIKDIQGFIDKTRRYLTENSKQITSATSHKKVPASTKREIRSAKKKLQDGIEDLQKGIIAANTPEDFTHLSLSSLDLGQPFVELQNKVEHAIKLISEKKGDTEIHIDIPIRIEEPRQTRTLVKKVDTVLITKFIPEYPQEFKGKGYFAIIGFKINKTGKPTTTSVVRSSGNSAFDQFCQKQALKLEFSPAKAYYKDKPGTVFTIESESQYPFKCN
ncbi:TonB family protein [Candidatus Calescamantes bacterium]|nr:TonB family protein [Candidatus Calescamantes bacterium]